MQVAGNPQRSLPYNRDCSPRSHPTISNWGYGRVWGWQFRKQLTAEGPAPSARATPDSRLCRPIRVLNRPDVNPVDALLSQEQVMPLEAYTNAEDVRPRPLTLPTRSPGVLDPLDALVRGAPAAAAAQAAAVRKTKLVATIGPASCSQTALFKLADAGMNVVRLNMSHGTHDSHRAIVDLVKEYNASHHNALATMLDTKGPEVRSGDLAEPLDLKKGEQLVFTIQEGANGVDRRVSVNYDGFIDDVSVGDVLLVDGGLMSCLVTGKSDTDVQMEVVDGGLLTSRRHLNVRGKSATLPAITEKDWTDLAFGVEVGVDYYALSFVQDARVIYEVKRWLLERNSKIKVLAKIESADSVKALEDILDAADGAMVARGDLGAELAVEEVPYWQNRIIQGCRRRGKPVIVATNMLESMVVHPAPTRAEVSDIAIAVREGADAVMLSGETAYGRYPLKAVRVQSTVALRTEAAMTRYQGTRRFGSEEAPPIDWIVPPSRRAPANTDAALSEMFAYHATTMANTVHAPLLVFSRQGNMPALLSHYRPEYPVFAFTDNPQVQRHLALYHGVVALALEFQETAEDTFDAALRLLVQLGYLGKGRLAAIVQSGRRPIWRSASTHIIQVRRVEKKHLPQTDSLDSADDS